ncbi:MAG: FG-GAP repeat protein [Ardenticatenaceae bacterium]|nr:FG-GAP repeat protein [Ardenticatenaceae bacterium]
MKGKRWEPLSLIIGAACLITAVIFTKSVHSQQTSSLLSLPGLAATPWYDEGDQHGADFAAAVNGAGDVNGDGYGDIIVGAPKYTASGYPGGTAFVYYGAVSGLPLQPQWTTGGDILGSRFGGAVNSAGDVNGDGYDDILIGAYEYTIPDVPFVSHQGRVYLFYGSASGLGSDEADWTFAGDCADENLGYAVASAGDINGDGYDDIVVGARRYEQDDKKVGAVLVFYGSANGLTQIAPDWMVIGDDPGADFGTAVNTAGDVNHDGYDDIIVGAPNYDNGQEVGGAAFVYYGSATGLNPAGTPNWMAHGGVAEASFGMSADTAGDVNNDGYDDIIIGAPRYPGSADYDGAVFVYHGSSSGLSTSANWTAVPDQLGSLFGYAAAAAGDVNNDGYDDVIVGAYRYNDNPEDGQNSIEGAAFVYWGAPVQLQTTSWRAVGEKAETEFGFAVGTTGDITGDGNQDIIVGAPRYQRDSKTILGRVYVYFGQQNDFEWPYQTYLPLIVSE